MLCYKVTKVRDKEDAHRRRNEAAMHNSAKSKRDAWKRSVARGHRNSYDDGASTGVGGHVPVRHRSGSTLMVPSPLSGTSPFSSTEVTSTDEGIDLHTSRSHELVEVDSVAPRKPRSRGSPVPVPPRLDHDVRRRSGGGGGGDRHRQQQPPLQHQDSNHLQVGRGGHVKDGHHGHQQHEQVWRHSRGSGINEFLHSQLVSRR